MYKVATFFIARSHHGSVSKEQRAITEQALKSGELRCVVATSSLELGIDMGAVDLVIQVATPLSVASGLQRIGRAGHQVGGVSKGLFFPRTRRDLVDSAVIVECMFAGRLENLTPPHNPLGVPCAANRCRRGDGCITGRRMVLPRTPCRTVERSAKTCF